MKRASLLERFQCTGPACPDTCCRIWSMQLDDETFAAYEAQAPELLSAVAHEADGLRVMKRDPATSACVKLDGGLCAIHRDYGAQMLGDACYFYPRVTRKLGNMPVMSAMLSCPETVRLALWGEANPAQLTVAAPGRLPHHMRDYLPEGVSEEQAIAIHEFFVTEAVKLPAEAAMARLCSIAASLGRLPVSQWAAAIPIYWGLAASALPPASPHETDAVHLLQSLCGLAVATRKTLNPRLLRVIDSMQRALHTEVAMDSLALQVQSAAAAALGALKTRWKEVAVPFAPLLQRWLAMELSAALFPFSGLGGTPFERIAIIVVRLATLKLALAALAMESTSVPPQEDIILVVQSLSRLLDHLGDPVFSLAIYKEAGWLREERLLGLLYP